MSIEMVVVGASAGGIDAIKTVIKDLPDNFLLPIVTVLHISDKMNHNFADLFRNDRGIAVREVEEKRVPMPRSFYLAPPGYHLFLEPDHSFGLSVEEKVNWARPSIDLLFESAAASYGKKVAGVILTGANGDGASGLSAIRAAGGLGIVQDPRTAYAAAMPEAALKESGADFVLPLDEIGALLGSLSQ